MFTIDLLKGEGIPVRSGPGGVIIAVVAFVVPVITVLAVFSLYVSNKIYISAQHRAVTSLQGKIEKLSDALELQKAFEEEKENINCCLSEAASTIGRHTQWSEVLIAVAKNIPDTVRLTSLNVKESFVTKKVARKDNPEKTVDVTVPMRILEMTVSGKPNYNNDRAVRDFRDRLLICELLKPKLKEITVAKGVEEFGNEDIVSYDMSCIFKEGT
ncbi:MAG: hypothetical protein JXB29_10675 [Sedimentisphaerales bacterium]|nr:hypothetical protein [Sedimentisphaerales bacterium]